MMNPLFGLLGGNGMNPFQGTPFGNMMNFMNYANQMRQQFQGNPQQQIQNMVQSGAISQGQVNGYIQQAQGIQAFVQQMLGRHM